MTKKLLKLIYSISTLVIILSLFGCNRYFSKDDISKYYDPDSLHLLIQNPNPNIAILDVRSENEYNSGHIPKSINFCYCDIEKCLKDLPKSKKYIIYCQTGYRSNKVFEILKDNGYKNILDWGEISRWSNEFELQ